MAKFFDKHDVRDLMNNNNWFKQISRHVHLPPVQKCDISDDNTQSVSCRIQNCHSVLEYYFVHTHHLEANFYNKDNLKSCAISNLSTDNLSSLWTIDEIDVLLTTEILPFSYRRTILDWVRRKYCIHMWDSKNINLRNCKKFNDKSNGIPADVRTIAILTEFEMIIGKTVEDLVSQYKITDKRTVLKLKNCLHDMYALFRAGDTNKNDILDFVESIYIFEAAGTHNPEMHASYLFDNYDEKQMSFSTLLMNHKFLIEQCGVTG